METETLLLHYGYESDRTNACAVPIYQTSSYRFESIEQAQNLFSLSEKGYLYTRIHNPTQDILEKRLAIMHNASCALALSSGQAAISTAILNLASSNDNIISTKYLYGGTYNLFKHTLSKLSIETKFAQNNEPENFEKLLDNRTKAIYLESIGNPTNTIADFEAIAKVAHKNQIPLIVDNTVSPYIFDPFKYGADIIVYSLTKFITGNGTSIGGAIVEKGDFNWNNEKFKDFFVPDESYHGISFFGHFTSYSNDNFTTTAFVSKARLKLLRDFGSCISPFNAFLSILGLETLSLRMRQHCSNALEIANFLEHHPKVKWVNYPGLESHSDNQRAKYYFKNGFGGIVGFGLLGGFESAKKFINNLKLIVHLANIGDARSLIIHPASTTHQQLSKQDRKEALVEDDFLRLSVGIENVNDIIADISQALEKV